jgi:5-(carboxyamino)imidazole ribonucleotide synthase
LGSPAVLKAARFGYDGKGQVKISAGDNLEVSWQQMGGSEGIIEGFINFSCEISVVLSRGRDGSVVAYPAVENRHSNHILSETIAPAHVASDIAAEADRVACRIAEALDYVGVLGVEMFVTRDGRVLVNEIAPRPHNSGHWTIDACVTSQFEQQIRAVCGLPLGSVEPRSDAVMTNLIGGDVERWREFMAEPSAKLHLYGKAEARPGRKMGHVTRLLPLSRMPP